MRLRRVVPILLAITTARPTHGHIRLNGPAVVDGLDISTLVESLVDELLEDVGGRLFGLGGNVGGEEGEHDFGDGGADGAEGERGNCAVAAGGWLRLRLDVAHKEGGEVAGFGGVHEDFAQVADEGAGVSVVLS